MLTAIVAFVAVYLLLRSWRLIALVALIAYVLAG
jgi:uncharacterized membrane protein